MFNSAVSHWILIPLYSIHVNISLDAMAFLTPRHGHSFIDNSGILDDQQDGYVKHVSTSNENKRNAIQGAFVSQRGGIKWCNKPYVQWNLHSMCKFMFTKCNFLSD